MFVTATMSLVVAPIARLTELLTEMAGVIGLGGASTVDKLIDEALCARVMDKFGGNFHVTESEEARDDEKELQ